MSKKSLKRRIKNLEDQNDILNEDLDSVVLQVQDLEDRMRSLWNFSPPKINTNPQPIFQDAWKFTTENVGTILDTTRMFKEFFTSPAKPKFNDEG